MASQDGLGTWEGSLIIEGGPASASQEGRLIFIFNLDILYFWSMHFFFLIIKADVQCMFDRPQVGCFS